MNSFDNRPRGFRLRQTFRGVCHFVGAHPDVAAESNAFDRGTIVAQGVLLALAITLAAAAWWAFLGTFLPGVAAVFGAVLVAAMIGLLDRFMMCSDWRLAGILSDDRPPLFWWARLGARVGVALLFAQATAHGLTLYFFDGAIDAQLQRDRTAANAPLVQEYAARKGDERRQTLGTLEAEVAELQSEREALQARVAALTELRREQLVQARAASIEAARQDDGLGGRVPGQGDLYDDARRLEAAALAGAAEAEGELAGLKARLAEVLPALETQRDALAAAVTVQAMRERALDAALVDDPRWVGEHRDPLSAYLGLAQLKRDPELGSAVRYFERLFILVLLGLELSVLLIKFLFSPASVYTVRLIERTKREATQVVTEETDRTREVVRRQGGRGRLRLVETGEGQDDPNRGEGNG